MHSGAWRAPGEPVQVRPPRSLLQANHRQLPHNGCTMTKRTSDISAYINFLIRLTQAHGPSAIRKHSGYSALTG